MASSSSEETERDGQVPTEEVKTGSEQMVAASAVNLTSGAERRGHPLLFVRFKTTKYVLVSPTLYKALLVVHDIINALNLLGNKVSSFLQAIVFY